MAHNHAVPHAPHARVAVPPVQILAVEQRLESVLRKPGGAKYQQQQHAFHGQAFSIFTEFSRTSFTGRSCAARGTSEIFFTTAKPSVTSPKMLCLLSSHGVAATV